MTHVIIAKWIVYVIGVLKCVMCVWNVMQYPKGIVFLCLLHHQEIGHETRTT